jgi:hypothetical protein
MSPWSRLGIGTKGNRDSKLEHVCQDPSHHHATIPRSDVRGPQESICVTKTIRGTSAVTGSAFDAGVAVNQYINETGIAELADIDKVVIGRVRDRSATRARAVPANTELTRAYLTGDLPHLESSQPAKCYKCEARASRRGFPCDVKRSKQTG